MYLKIKLPLPINSNAGMVFPLSNRLPPNIAGIRYLAMSSLTTAAECACESGPNSR